MTSAATTNDYFSLEALNARHGDALVLHHGTRADPRHILIDGGPGGVYAAHLRPRLAQIGQRRGALPLPLSHVMVTHLDSDHIRGVLDLAREMREGSAPAQTGAFWFNTFDDALSQLPAQTAALLQEAGGQAAMASLASMSAVTASVAEGRSLRDTVRELPVLINGGSGKPLMAEGKAQPLRLSRTLQASLVCPNRKHLQALAEDWAKKSAQAGATRKAERAAYLDRSVYNLSSLVLVVAAKGRDGRVRRMLLTGDARGDHILAGLQLGGFLTDGRLHVELLKVSHHGSDRNHEEDFFERITADHYVVSADGRHDNPSQDVLVWIGRHAPAHALVHLTNRHGTGYASLQEHLAAAAQAVPSLAGRLRFRDDAAPSLTVDLLEPIPF